MVPNLNEIMEEYTEREDETVQVTQAEAWKSEERVEVSAELEQTVEELKKRKRGDGEARA